MRRNVGLFMVFGAVLPLAVASVAWACGNLASLQPDQKVVSPGQAITFTGRNYSAFTGANPVILTLKSRNGQVLATTQADSSGRINQTTFVPNSLSPGWYVVLSQQFNSNGTPRAGTPGRTSFRVQGTSNNAEAAPAGWGSSNGSGPSGSAAPVAGDGGGSTLMMLLAAGLSLSMLGLGWTLVGRKTRTLPGTQLGA